jgi:hypothetical protein
MKHEENSMKKIALLTLLLFCLAIPAAYGQTKYADWPSNRYDQARTGRTPGVGKLTQLCEKWNYYTGGSLSRTQTHVEDVNGDKIQEILMVLGGKLVAKNSAGDIIWETKPYAISRIYGTFDFNNDGILDIVVAAILDGYAYGGTIIFSGKTGEVEWSTSLGYPMAIPNKAYNSDITISLVTHPSWHGIHVWDFHKGFSKPYPVVPTSFYSDWGYYPYPSQKTHTKFQGGHPNHLWYNNEYGYNGGNPILVYDIDLDSKLELVMETHGYFTVFDAATGTQKYTYKYASSYVFGYFEIAFIDDDPYPEIIATGPSGHGTSLYVVDVGASGMTLRWKYEWNIDNSASALFNVPEGFVSDFDGDGKFEILGNLTVAKANGGDDKWHLILFKTTDGSQLVNLENRYIQGVADVDGDGQKEILAKDANPDGSIPLYGNIYVYDYTAGALKIKWLVEQSEFSFESFSMPAMSTWNEGKTHCYSTGFRIKNADLNGDKSNDVYIFSDGNKDAQPDSLKILDGKAGSIISEYERPKNTLITVLLTQNNISGSGTFPNQTLLNSNDGYFDILSASLKRVGRVKTGGYQLQPIAADINDDDVPDVLIRESTGLLSVLNVKAASAMVPPASIWSEKNYLSGYDVTQVVDLNKDGLNETVVVDSELGIPKVIVFSSTGTILWKRIFNDYTGSRNINSLNFGKLNNDETLDIVLMLRLNGNGPDYEIALSGVNGEKLWQYSWDNFYQNGVGEAMADLDADGYDEMLLSTYKNMWLIDQNGAVLKGPYTSAANGNGSYVTIIASLADGINILRGPAVSNITAHNSNDATQLKWALTVDEGIWRRTPAIVKDPQRGNYNNALIINFSSQMKYLSGLNGTQLATAQISPGKYDTSSMVVGDINNDKNDEVVLGSQDGFLYAYTVQSTSLTKLWEYDFGYNVGNPILADTDGDGDLEIIVSVGDGNVYNLDNNCSLENPDQTCGSKGNLAIATDQGLSSKLRQPIFMVGLLLLPIVALGLGLRRAKRS